MADQDDSLRCSFVIIIVDIQWVLTSERKQVTACTWDPCSALRNCVSCKISFVSWSKLPMPQPCNALVRVGWTRHLGQHSASSDVRKVCTARQRVHYIPATIICCLCKVCHVSAKQLMIVYAEKQRSGPAHIRQQEAIRARVLTVPALDRPLDRPRALHACPLGLRA